MKWVMSYINLCVSISIWKNHVTYERVMSHMNESCHIRKWVMSHMKMSHVTSNICVSISTQLSLRRFPHFSPLFGPIRCVWWYSVNTYIHVYIYIYNIYIYICTLFCPIRLMIFCKHIHTYIYIYMIYTYIYMYPFLPYPMCLMIFQCPKILRVRWWKPLCGICGKSLGSFWKRLQFWQGSFSVKPLCAICWCLYVASALNCYGMATISRLLKTVGLFCKRAL